MRNRMINKDFWHSRSLARVSRDARLLFVGLWNEADDEGRLFADLRYLCNQIFPFGDVSLDDFYQWVSELESIESVVLYESNGELFILVPNFLVYQSISRPTKSKLPEPSGRFVPLNECSITTRGVLIEDSILKERKGKEGPCSIEQGQGPDCSFVVVRDETEAVKSSAGEGASIRSCSSERDGVKLSAVLGSLVGHRRQVQ
jgi:hypothetical protein